jgi:hypothetical protein
MNKPIFLLFLMTISFGNAQSLVGDWSGNFTASGQEIPIVLHLSETDNSIEATVDLPSQGASDIPADHVSLKERELELSLMQGQVSLKAQIDGDAMTGIFSQGGLEFPLTLSRGELQKPGDVSLPSSDEELDVLADKEVGNYSYNVSDYFAKPASSSFQLSPNGTYISYREKDDNLKNHVYVKNIETNQVQRVITEGEELVRGYGWANDSRLIYVMDKGGNEDYHLFAVNVDGSNQKELTPYDGVRVEILVMLKDDKDHMIISMNKNNPQVFDPYKINIVTRTKLYRRTIKSRTGK